MNRLALTVSLSAGTNCIRTAVVVTVLGIASFTSLSAGEAIQAYATLMLKDGRQFDAVQVVNCSTTGVVVRHAKGAALFRYEVLPASVIADLHLEGWDSRRVPATGFDPSLADKVAVAAPSNLALADHSAVAPASFDKAAVADNHAVTAGSGLAEASAIRSSPADIAMPEAQNITPAAWGASDVPMVSAASSAPANGAPVDLPGRIVVKLPTGDIHFLGDVEIRAYPAGLLAEHLVNAKARAREAAERFMAQAGIAAQEGRVNEYNSLVARAQTTAAGFLDYLPAAPVVARSDEFGNFTLRHNLHDIRIVARGRVGGGQGEWSFDWVGIAAEAGTHLTESNATQIIPAVLSGGSASKYVSR